MKITTETKTEIRMIHNLIACMGDVEATKQKKKTANRTKNVV